jgi:hypothetical protein
MGTTNSTVPNLGYAKDADPRAVQPLSTLTIVPGDFAMYNTSGHYWDIYSNVTGPAYFGGFYAGQQPPQSNPFPSGAGIPSVPEPLMLIQQTGVFYPGIALKASDTVEDGSPLAINNASSVTLNGGADTLAAPTTIGYAWIPGGGTFIGDGTTKIPIRIRSNFPSPFLAK